MKPLRSAVNRAPRTVLTGSGIFFIVRLPVFAVLVGWAELFFAKPNAACIDRTDQFPSASGTSE